MTIDPGQILDGLERERLRLVELDQDQTNEFVKGILTTGAAIRASGFTMWLAVLGFSLQQRLWPLALLASLVSMAFWMLDSYYGWLYERARTHQVSVESLMADYYNMLSRYRDNADSLVRFRGKLRAYRYGVFRSFSARFSYIKPWKSGPQVIYAVLYPALILIALAAALLIALTAPKQNSPTRVEIVNQPPSISTTSTRPSPVQNSPSPRQTSVNSASQSGSPN